MAAEAVVVDIHVDSKTEGVIRGPASSKVAPLQVVADDTAAAAAAAVEVVDEAWLPVTESRNGNAWTASFQLISSGIGVQLLALPFAFIMLGWFWGILCLSLFYAWQLYTTWLLVNLHESSADNGSRYSRFLHLSILAFGNKWGRILSTFPVMYLSGGTCVLFTITGGGLMEQLHRVLWCDGAGGGDEHYRHTCSDPLTGALWFLVFIFIAITLAHFFPNLNSLAWLSLIGSTAAISFSTLIWVLSIAKDRPESVSYHPPEEAAASEIIQLRHVLRALGIIAFVFRGHNLVLEIQGTIHSTPEKRSKKVMWRAVLISYTIILAACLFPIAIGGYWGYGDKMTADGGILKAYIEFHQQSTSKLVLAIIHMTLLIHYLCAFQVYAMIVFDNLERVYVSKKNQPCPRLVRHGLRVLFGGIVYFISVTFPFLPSLGALIGAIVLPLTLTYPCFMWNALTKKKHGPNSTTRLWFLNTVLGSLGVILSASLLVSALWKLVEDGLDANFFNPR